MHMILMKHMFLLMMIIIIRLQRLPVGLVSNAEPLDLLKVVGAYERLQKINYKLIGYSGS